MLLPQSPLFFCRRLSLLQGIIGLNVFRLPLCHCQPRLSRSRETPLRQSNSIISIQAIASSIPNSPRHRQTRLIIFWSSSVFSWYPPPIPRRKLDLSNYNLSTLNSRLYPHHFIIPPTSKFANISTITTKTLLLLLVSFSLGALGTFIFTSRKPFISFREIRNPQQFKFINPLLECEQADFSHNTNLNRLRNQIKTLTNNLITAHQANLISVYYRDLNNGPWFGINEKEDFSPASLVKVPLMLAYYKIAESNPKILEKTIANSLPPQTESQNIGPRETLTPGQSYTINDLIFRMIAYSDNLAYDLLSRDIDPKTLISVYHDLGIDISQGFTNPAGNILSVKDYASFFRILYNSSYLSKTMSEKALSLLSQSEYKKGLVAGIPPGLTVSHKFGERQFLATGEKQLHDCGIIYSSRPYLLCLMTRGSQFESLQNSLKQISALVYRSLD